MRNAVLAYDEGAGVGLGHRRRIEALAAALRDIEWRVHTGPVGADGVHGEVVVLDSYLVRADDRAAVQGDVVVAIDDLERDLAVDIMVDPSPGSDARRHRRAGLVLVGAAFALVPPLQPTVPIVAPDGPVTRVLVTTGASDVAGIGEQLAAAVHAAVPDVEVRLVVGPWGHPGVPDGVVGVAAPDGLADELAAAPVVVTGGGVALLEACLLGRVIVAIELADNQRHAIAGLQAAGAVVTASAGMAGRQVAALIAEPERRRALATAAHHALDGLGPQRVAEAIENFVATRETV